VHCHNLKYCGTSLTTLSRAKVIALLMGACTWQRCTLVPVPHCLACEQTQAYKTDVSKARIASVFRTSYSVSCDFLATRTAAGLLFDIDATRDRGSTWQHGRGPEGKIRGRWGQFAIPLSVPPTRSPSLYTSCSQHVAQQHVCMGRVTLVNFTGLRSFAIYGRVNSCQGFEAMCCFHPQSRSVPSKHWNLTCKTT